MEKSYEDISVRDCAKMLNLNEANVPSYISDRGWSIRDGRIKFEAFDEEKKAEETNVPTKELAQMVLTYAKEMEKIV
jgi:hypothetical protein